MVDRFFLILCMIFVSTLFPTDKEDSRKASSFFKIEKGGSCTVSIINSSSTSSALPIVEITQSTENDQKNDQKNDQISILLNEQMSIIKGIQSQLVDQESKLNTIQDHQTDHISQLKTIQDQVGQSLENIQEQKSQQLQVNQSLEDQQYFLPPHVSLENFVTLMQEHAISIACITVAGVYSYIFYQIYKINKILNDPLAWANWHNDKKIEELLALPAAQLQAELLYDFQHRYIDPADPMNFMYSIAQSSAILDKEIKLLKKQILIYQLIIQCRCASIFFITNKSVLLLEEKQRKLAFIKHVFSSWCAESKINKNK